MKIAAISIADYSECTEGMPHDVERLFFRMLLKMLSREGGLPDDDTENARIFGYKDVRTYKALKAKLANWPNAIVIADGLIINDRVESDLETYRDRKAAAVENGRIGGRSNKDRKKIAERSDGDRPEIDPRSSAEVETIPHATTNKNNELAKASPSPTPSPKEEKESKSPFSFSETARKPTGKEFWAKAIAPTIAPEDVKATFENGQLEIHNAFREFWLDEFDGDEKGLELALLTAANYVQPFGLKSLDVQVSAQLARAVRDKRERDARYAAATKERGSASVSWMDDERRKRSEFLAMARGETLNG